MAKSKRFERKLGSKIVVLTIIDSDSTPQIDRLNGIETSEFTGLGFDGVLNKLGFDNTYDLPTALKQLERRTLYAKMMFKRGVFTDNEAKRLADLTTELSDYSENYADGLFCEFVSALDEAKKLENYSPLINLSLEQRELRMKEAVEILEKLRLKRSQPKKP